MFVSLALLLQAVAAVSAAVVSDREVLYARANVNDPFYSYTQASLKGKSPGTILKNRSIAFPALKNAKDTYQLLYVTTSVEGAKIADVVSIATPKKPIDGVQQLLSVQSPEDSAALKCAPSFSLTDGDNSLFGPTKDMDTALGDGLVAISPDYESPASGFVAGPLAGMGVLDGIRATLNFKTVIKSKSSTRIGLIGYSGGALASGWAAQLQPKYAPELKIAGASLGGLTVNIKNILNNLNGGAFAGIAISGIAGVSSVYTEAGDYIKSHLNADGEAAFKKVTEQCILDDVLGFAFKDLFKYLDVPKATIYANSAIKKLFKEITLGASTPKIPLYIYWANSDQIIVPADLKEYVSDQCSKGARIQSKIYAFGEHLTTQATGSADAFTYIKARLAGTAAPGGCKQTSG